jgi:hypothetical protein
VTPAGRPEGVTRIDSALVGQAEEASEMRTFPSRLPPVSVRAVGAKAGVKPGEATFTMNVATAAAPNGLAARTTTIFCPGMASGRAETAKSPSVTEAGRRRES